METYACLLRGINVGGNNIIPMAKLQKTFEGLGYQDVKTLIASGNVVFRTKPTEMRTLEVRLEKQLATDYKYAAKVVVKSREEMAAIVAALPRAWSKPTDATHRYYVMFLRHTIDNSDVIETIKPKSGVEWLDYVPGALYWRALKKDLGKSSVAKMPAKLYADMTARNWNTTLKLSALVVAQSHLPRA
ncbi:MAG: DUF1697 domain-containing protein [Kofleriaceae bacterium]